MIGETMVLLKNELGSYLKQDTVYALPNGNLLLDNIADLEGNKEKLKDHVIITLVNIEEENTLKNMKSLVKNGISNGIVYREPPVYLNLYLLFCATYEGEGKTYEKALGRLSNIIRFFQSKRQFTVYNSPGSIIANAENISQEERNELRILVELYTLTFEQINHLWGSLGGKQLPSVLFKARLVKIEDNIVREVPVIEEVREDDELIYKPS